MIQIQNLKKAFGQTLASDIPSFQVNDGDILGLVGNNGAGKTTLFRMILDLLKPDEGEVSIDGVNPATSESWKEQTGAYIDEGFLIDFPDRQTGNIRLTTRASLHCTVNMMIIAPMTVRTEVIRSSGP